MYEDVVRPFSQKLLSHPTLPYGFSSPPTLTLKLRFTTFLMQIPLDHVNCLSDRGAPLVVVGVKNNSFAQVVISPPLRDEFVPLVSFHVDYANLHVTKIDLACSLNVLRFSFSYIISVWGCFFCLDKFRAFALVVVVMVLWCSIVSGQSFTGTRSIIVAKVWF